MTLPPEALQAAQDLEQHPADLEADGQEEIVQALRQRQPQPLGKHRDVVRGIAGEQRRMTVQQKADRPLALPERRARHAGFFREAPRNGTVVVAGNRPRHHLFRVGDAVKVAVALATDERHRQVQEVLRQSEFAETAAADVAAPDVVAGRLLPVPDLVAVKSGEHQPAFQHLGECDERVVFALHAVGQEHRLGKVRPVDLGRPRILLELQAQSCGAPQAGIRLAPLRSLEAQAHGAAEMSGEHGAGSGIIAG